MSEPPEDILQDLEHLFAWSPLAHIFVSPYESDKYADDNSSREPTFYDMHLAPNRICKRVVHVRNLHKNVANVVDERLRAIRNRAISLQPPTVPGFVSRGRRHAKQDPDTCSPMANRKSIEEYYMTITSEFCAPVASSLALHPKYWGTLIRWSMSPRHEQLGGRAPSLHLIPMGTVQERFVPEHFSLETFEQLKKIRAESNDLATWEIIGLTIEDTDAMLGVLPLASALGGDGFQWKLCSGIPCTPVDGNIPKMLSATQACDAPGILSLVEEPRIGSESSTTGALCSAESVLNESLCRGGSSIQSVREDIYLKISESDIEWESESESDGEAREASIARAIEEMSWTPPDWAHPASQELIQKAWGQSVRQNSTLLILHAGNYEYVCIRHRESQTLYISDILHIQFLKEPGYGKVQVGIYIVALEDALHRIALDNNSNSPALPAARSLPEEAAVQKRSRKSSRRRSNKRQRTVDLEWITQQATSREYLLLHIHYDIYDTINPEIFHRVPAVTPEEADITPEPATLVYDVPKDERLLLYLNSELGQGATGVVHGGALEVEDVSGRNSSRLDIAAKLSFTDTQRERLQQEWSVYMYLTMEGIQGIPTLLGLFYDPELEDRSPLCLLMCYAGLSLQRSGRSITSAQRDAFLAVLKAIHAAGVYHGDLRYENLVVDASGEVAIIDFDRAIINAKESDMKAELRVLRRLLESRVDDSALEEAKAEGGRASRAQKGKRGDDPIPGRVTRSMGTARETLSGMRLRPRR